MQKIIVNANDEYAFESVEEISPKYKRCHDLFVIVMYAQFSGLVIKVENFKTIKILRPLFWGILRPNCILDIKAENSAQGVLRPNSTLDIKAENIGQVAKRFFWP